MYTPGHFKIRDDEAVLRFLGEHSFGALLVAGPGGVEVAHAAFLPVVEAGELARLDFHLARPNPAWRAALEAPEVTVLFQGPDAYVSASWYERPEAQVPTWNYAAVEVKGRARGPLEREELVGLLDRLAENHERGEARPWRRESMQQGTFEAMLPGIVGLAIEVTSVTAKFKLSQNRSPADRGRVAAALRERGAPGDLGVERWMRTLGVIPEDE